MARRLVNYAPNGDKSLSLPDSGFQSKWVGVGIVRVLQATVK